MLNSRDLEIAAMSLPLEEREELAAAIEESISVEYDRRTRDAIASDVQRIESMLAQRPLTKEQIAALEDKLIAGGKGKGSVLCWENVSREIVSHLRHCG